jgi:transposase
MLQKLFADRGYQGPKFREEAKQVRRGLKVENVNRPDPGFNVLPKRRVGEQNFAWLGRCRRLAKVSEYLSHHALAFRR